MKNKLLLISTFLAIVLLSACGNERNTPTASTPPDRVETKTYQSEQGPVETPKNPKRIVALTYAPNVLALRGELVGVDEWSKKNPLFSKDLENVEIVSDTDLEKIMSLRPDLIIMGAEMKNTSEMSKIAPTIVYTWGKKDFLTQHLEIAKLINKEEEAREWVNDFKGRAESVGKEIKARFGDRLTVSVFETDGQQFYVFGDKWARGTEVLYQSMGLRMPDRVKEDALGPGYYTLSQEVLPDYSGDFIVLSRDFDADASFKQSAIWKSIPAVKNEQVIEIDTKSSTYSDPITLDHLLGVFKEAFLGQ